jgi:hypothetical protein
MEEERRRDGPADAPECGNASLCNDDGSLWGIRALAMAAATGSEDMARSVASTWAAWA